MKSPFGSLDDFQNPAPGKLLGDLSEKLTRDIHPFGNFLSGHHDPLSKQGKVKDTAHRILSSSGQSHKSLNIG
jgi:hypothetical protein